MRVIIILLVGVLCCVNVCGQTISPSGNATYCIGGSVTLTVNGASAGSGFQWEKDGISVGTNINTYNANANGSYTVIITVGSGTPDTLGPVAVTSTPNPIADFSFTNNICSGTSVAFTSTVTSGTPGYTYAWNFGDAGTSDVSNPSHTFTSLGCGTVDFDVKLTVRDSKGCITITTKTITVKQAPDVRVTDLLSPGTPFSNCANDPSVSNPNYTVSVGNISPGDVCIADYVIDWGDGNIDSNVSFPKMHTYIRLGAFNLKVSAVGTNGCSNTKTYTVANQKNPDIGIGTFGLTEGCVDLPVNIVLSLWTTNSPGTTYLLQYGDDLSTSFTHPINQAYTNDTTVHTYTTTSCPDKPVYNITITAANACRTKSFIGGDIVIKKKPQSDFIIPDSSYCVGESVCFTNITKSGYDVNCNTFGAVSWDFGDPSSGPLNTSMDVSPCHSYATPGSYTISLTTTNVCGPSTITHTVCITAPPAPAFTLSDTTGCIPFTTNATNTTNTFNSCENATYSWTISSYSPTFCGTSASWDFAPGSSETSTNPSFVFNNAGTYTIEQSVTNACGTFKSSKIIKVKKPPTVSIALPPYSCGIVNITPVAVVEACTDSSLTYAWTFEDGNPATAITADPGNIMFTTAGPHLISLTITNECGTVTHIDSVVLTTAPDVLTPADQLLCGGLTMGPFNFTSNIGAPEYTWSNNNTSIELAAGGSGNIPAFTAVNNGTTPVEATIIVTPSVSNCVGIPDTFIIKVNPKPAAPAATTPFTYCQNATASPLTATATGANILTWYNNPSLIDGTAIPPIPSTAIAGTTLYYVTQTNSFSCLSDAAIIAINVAASINGNTLIGNQNICANTAPNPLTSGTVNGGGGIYAYQWQSSVNNGSTWQNISGANNNTYAPGILNDTIQYRRIISSIPCADTSNIVTINVAGALVNFNISPAQIICEGFTPSLINGDLPEGGGGSYTYQWQGSTDNFNWSDLSGATDQNYQPPPLSASTFYRRIVNTTQCSATSNVAIITVHPTPLATITATNNSICVYNTSSVQFVSTAGTAPFNIELVITKPDAATDTIRQTVNSNGPVNILAVPAMSVAGNYSIRLTKLSDSKGCENTAVAPAIIITVKPLPELFLTNSSPVCNGVSATLTVNGADTYSWSPDQFINTITGNTVTVTPPSTATYLVRGTLNGCFKDTSILVTVIPGAAAAAAGPDQILCNAISATLAGNPASVNSEGAWSQLSGPPVTILNSTQSNSTVSGLSAGSTYVFRWIITGQAPCSATEDGITIDVLSPIINVIGNDTIICNGQPATLITQSLSGGNSTAIAPLYSYQWESTAAGLINWQNVAGANAETLSVSPAESTCYRRKVKTNDLCETISNPICVTVNPTISNNIITANQQVCVNTPVSTLQGATPTGGDNVYTYQWQTSTDSVSWSNISSDINYQPSTYSEAGLHYFRRNAASGNCTSVSNVVTIRVRPNSKAIFTSNPTINCAPFDLSAAVIIAALPDSNGTYMWYDDGTLFGSNTTGIFPGYTITNPGDSVLIKLVTTSPFGCQPDSIVQEFIAVKTAVANFTKDTAGGCGPLNVTFTNTSNILNNSIQFFWDFGNGDTSPLAQPGTVSFVQSPFFNDTTYQITLKAYNGCDTTVWRDSVKIRSNPKARFGIDTTSGCSPFTVNITNNSLGAPNTYYWDFGNGHKDTTFVNGVLNYTYNIGNMVDTFPIRLIAVNECYRDTQTINVRIAPNAIKPQITIDANDLFGCTPHIVAFNNATIGATRFIWDYGDNTVPDSTNNSQSTVVHTFTKAGIFTVSIRLTNGCSDTTVYRQVTVFEKPKAGFITNATVYCLGDSIRTDNQSLNASNYTWFWGDGQSSSGFNPTHAYSVAGDYTILLRAEKTNNTGIVCFDTLVKSITVLVKPDVRVQSNITNINCAPFTLNATAPGIINETVTWHITDTTVSPSLVMKSGISTQYIFNKPGTFSIKMVAVNAFGCKDSAIQTFVVRGTPVVAFTPANLSVCKIDTTVSYLNTTTFNDNGPLTYSWLVDGVLQSGNGNFTFRYVVPASILLPRTFVTQLIATNTVGCSDTANGTLQINPEAKAQFIVNNPNTCVPFVASVTNTSQYSSRYKWLLNGVALDTAFNPTIAITQSLTPYTLTLIADNIYGCSPDTFSVTFTSRIKPTAVFTLNDTLGCTGVLNVVTNNQSTNANSYQWDWGDNSAGSSFKNPTHLYTVPGQYLITMVASDGACKDTAYKLITVANKPLVDFSADDTLTCDTARIQFTNLTSNGNGYLWSFSDGTFSTDTDPVKNFAPGQVRYTVKLTAYNNAGCKDSLIKSNLIFAIQPPVADFQISPSPVITVPDYTFTFNNLTLNSNTYTYQWSLGDGAFAATRDVTHKYADTGNYPVRLIVLDNSTGCPDTALQFARIEGFPGYLFVPNAFYPNSLRNEFKTFKPLGKGLADYNLQVFDSWGKLLFETRELDAAGSPVAAWDGTDKAKGVPMPQDAYAWRITAHFKSGKKWDGMQYDSRSGRKQGNTFGTVTLFR